MENKICRKCKQTTQHRNDPVANPLSEEAVLQTCLQCGVSTTVIPYIESLTINANAMPIQLDDGEIMIEVAESISVNGRQVKNIGPIRIKIDHLTRMTTETVA